MSLPFPIVILGIFGIAWVIADSKISLPLRKIVAARSIWAVTLLECPACLSFWFGLAAGFGMRLGAEAILFAFACTATSLVLYSLAGGPRG